MTTHIVSIVDHDHHNEKQAKSSNF